MLNGINRLSIGQQTTAGGNNQTAINGAGSGAVLLNASNGAGTGGVIIGSGGASSTQVAAFDSSGNESLLGSLKFFNAATLAYEWECSSGTSCTLYNSNATTPGRVFVSYPNGQTDLDSEGSAAVTINNTATGGTGGFNVYEGGANSSVSAFSVSGAGATIQASNSQVGSASGTGNQTIGNHLNQLATADFAGSCAMSSVTSCTISFQHSWTSQPACGVSAGFALAGRVYYTWATNVVTIHSTSSETGTFYAICAGNPN